MRDLSDGIQNAFDILYCFDDDNRLLGISELSRRLNMPKSTTQRLVNNLRYRGMLEQDELTGKYRLGLKLLELGARALRQMDLPRRAKPHLQSLTAATGESSTLAVLDNFEALYVERADSPRLLRASSVGSRMALHCTAIGKVLLAALDDSEFERFVAAKGLPARTLHTITDARMLRECIAQIQQQMYAVDSNEYEEGLVCIAAPVLNYSGRIIASVGISAPATRAGDGNLQQLINSVCDAARSISREMGSQSG